MKNHSTYTADFLHFIAGRSLRYACCGECRQVLSFAQRVCNRHPRAALEWLPATGRATLHSFAVYRIGYSPALQPPYTVAVVELQEGPRLVSTLTGPSALQPRIGAALSADFDAAGRLMFSLDPEPAASARSSRTPLPLDFS